MPGLLGLITRECGKYQVLPTGPFNSDRDSRLANLAATYASIACVYLLANSGSGLKRFSLAYSRRSPLVLLFGRCLSFSTIVPLRTYFTKVSYRVCENFNCFFLFGSMALSVFFLG